MPRLRKTLLACLVWSTAAMTVVGGTPHVDCRCADGTVKPFGFGPGGWFARDCCRRTNAVAGGDQDAAPRPSQRRCPHCRTRAARPIVPERHSQLGSACCVKTLGQTAVFTDSHTRSAVSRGLSAGPVLATGAGPLPGSPGLAAGPTPRPPNQLAPPTDRIIAFQHLTI